MARALAFLFLFGFVSTAAPAQDAPRVEILRTSPVGSRGPALFFEDRRGTFLFLDQAPTGPSFRSFTVHRDGHLRLRKNIGADPLLGETSNSIIPYDNGEGIAPNRRGIAGIDSRGVGRLIATFPSEFGYGGSQLVRGKDGAFYGVTEPLSRNARLLYRWSAEDGFSLVHEFDSLIEGPYHPDPVVSVEYLGAAQDGGLFACLTEALRPLVVPSYRSIPSFSLVTVDAAGTARHGPPLIDAIPSGLAQLPDGRLVTVITRGSVGITQPPGYVFGTFDAGGQFVEITALTDFGPINGVRLLTVLPSSGTAIIELDSENFGARSIRLLAISPAGAAQLLPIPLRTGGLAGIYPTVLSHDGNLYGFGYRIREDSAIDRQVVFRIVDPAAVVQNLPPIARDDAVEVPAAITRGGMVEITLAPLRNDSDADHDPLTLESAEVDLPAVASIAPDGQHIVLSLPSAGPLAAVVKYRVADGRGGTAEANIVVRVPENGGRYFGLARGAEGGVPIYQAFLDVQVTRLGRVTGVFTMLGQRHFIRGQFDTEGHLDVPVADVTVGSFVLRLTREEQTVRGEFTFFSGTDTIVARQPARPTAGQAGRYTALFRSGPPATRFGMPEGTGWAVVKISPTGFVTMVGRLPDASPLSVGTRFDAASCFSFYTGVRRVTEPGRPGELFGTVFVRPGAASDGAGTLVWLQSDSARFERPEYFNGPLIVALSRYLPTAADGPAIADFAPVRQNGEFTLRGGHFESPWQSTARLVGDRFNTSGGVVGVIHRPDGRVTVRVPGLPPVGYIDATGVVFQATGHAEGVLLIRHGRVYSASAFDLAPR